MITFAAGVSVRLFSIPLATMLWSVSLWSDVAGVPVQIVRIRERLEGEIKLGEPLICLELETEKGYPRHRGELAHYLEGALAVGYLTDVIGGRVRVEWFPPPYTPH